MSSTTRILNLIGCLALAATLFQAAGARQAPSAAPPGAPAPKGREVGGDAANGKLAAEPPDELVVDGKVIGRRVLARAGDFCIIDKEDLHPGDAVYLVNGQRVALHWPDCYRVLQANPQEHLAPLQPRGAFLFALGERSPLAGGWFLFGTYILLGLAFAALCAHQALHRGRNPVAWFGAGLLFNAFAYAVLILRPAQPVAAPAGIPSGLGKIAATFAPSPCPKCGYENHPSAKRCSGCGAALSPRIESEVTRAGLSGR